MTVSSRLPAIFYVVKAAGCRNRRQALLVFCGLASLRPKLSVRPSVFSFFLPSHLSASLFSIRRLLVHWYAPAAYSPAAHSFNVIRYWKAFVYKFGQRSGLKRCPLLSRPPVCPITISWSFVGNWLFCFLRVTFDYSCLEPNVYLNLLIFLCAYRSRSYLEFRQWKQDYIRIPKMDKSVRSPSLNEAEKSKGRTQICENIQHSLYVCVHQTS